MMRYLQAPRATGQQEFELELASGYRENGGWQVHQSALTVPAPDSALSLSPWRVKPAPQSQGVGGGGYSCRKTASL